MFEAIRNWRLRRLLARSPIVEVHWRSALEHCKPAQRLSAGDQAALRVLATRFLDAKSVEPVQGLELDQAQRVLLATHACVPILKLGFDWYDGWHSVIVYPDAFDVRHFASRNMPQRWAPWECARLIGDLFTDKLRFPCPAATMLLTWSA